MLKIIVLLCALLPSIATAGLLEKANIDIVSVTVSEDENGANVCGLLINAVREGSGSDGFAGFNGSINLASKGAALIKGRHTNIKVINRGKAEPEVKLVTVPSTYIWFKVDGSKRTRPVQAVRKSRDGYALYVSNFEVAGEIITGIFSDKVLSIGTTRESDDMEVIYYGKPVIEKDVAERFTACMDEMLKASDSVGK